MKSNTWSEATPHLVRLKNQRETGVVHEYGHVKELAAFCKPTEQLQSARYTDAPVNCIRCIKKREEVQNS